MIEDLEADAALRDRYQFWTFGYSTGDPMPYSATLLRRDLDEARRKFDPDRSDAAFDRMVLVGHSMGGLLAKMMVQDSGTRLWRLISDRPVEDLAGDQADLRPASARALIFKPRPEVRRVVFIATPHRGSRVDRGGLEHLGSRLVRLPDPLRASYDRLMARNGPEFFTERFRKGLPTSIDELEWQSPMLMGLDELGLAPDDQGPFHHRGPARPARCRRERRPGPVRERTSRRGGVRVARARPATCARTIPPSSARSGASSPNTGRPEAHGIPEIRLPIRLDRKIVRISEPDAFPQGRRTRLSTPTLPPCDLRLVTGIGMAVFLGTTGAHGTRLVARHHAGFPFAREHKCMRARFDLNDMLDDSFDQVKDPGFADPRDTRSLCPGSRWLRSRISGRSIAPCWLRSSDLTYPPREPVRPAIGTRQHHNRWLVRCVSACQTLSKIQIMQQSHDDRVPVIMVSRNHQSRQGCSHAICSMTSIEGCCLGPDRPLVPRHARSDKLASRSTYQGSKCTRRLSTEFR